MLILSINKILICQFEWKLIYYWKLVIGFPVTKYKMETSKPASTSKLTAAVRVSIYQNVLTGPSSALPFRILLGSRYFTGLSITSFPLFFYEFSLWIYKHLLLLYFYTGIPVWTAGGICTRSQWLDCTLYKHTVRTLSMSFLIVLWEIGFSSIFKYMIYMYEHLYVGTHVRIAIGILDTTYPKETILFLIIIQQISGILQ